VNERIRELALQAGATTMQRSGWIDYGTLDLDVEKFAKLIVRESIVDFYRRYLDLESEEDITEQVNRYVKDNFGVEE
jgi:hypothetical protein